LGGAPTATGRKEKQMQGIPLKKLREEDRCEDLGVDGRIMIK
jgi:hypothetical protein